MYLCLLGFLVGVHVLFYVQCPFFSFVDIICRLFLCFHIFLPGFVLMLFCSLFPKVLFCTFFVLHESCFCSFYFIRNSSVET